MTLRENLFKIGAKAGGQSRKIKKESNDEKNPKAA